MAPGSAPSSPSDGSFWVTSAGAFVRVNGVTYQFTGRQARSNRVVTASGDINVTTSDDVVTVNKTTGQATTVNLPGSPSNGEQYTIVDGRGDANTNFITLVPASGLIIGQASARIPGAYGSLTVMYNGSAWSIL